MTNKISFLDICAFTFFKQNDLRSSHDLESIVFSYQFFWERIDLVKLRLGNPMLITMRGEWLLFIHKNGYKNYAENLVIRDLKNEI